MLTKSDKSKWFDQWSAMEVPRGHLLLISMEEGFSWSITIYVPMFVQNEKLTQRQLMYVQCWIHKYMYVHRIFIIVEYVFM